MLVQSWLPATQAIISGVAALGGGVTAARLALATVAALAATFGAVVAGRLGGRVATWAFLAPASFGPFLVWGGALYQEGTFLAVLFGGLALALTPGASPRRMLAADLVLGLCGLVRYEGWPVLLVYLVWRRDPRALASLWGPAAWLVVKFGLHAEGYGASPVNFDDWEGLSARTTWASWSHDAWRLVETAFASGALVYTGAAVAGIALLWRRRGVFLIVAIGLGQVAAVCGWLAGLEMATYRMLVVPVLIAGVLGAAGAGVLWERLGEPLRGVLALGIGILLGVGHLDAWRGVRAEDHRSAPERTLLARIERRPDCDWRITPRTRLGSRYRHDGCEVLQGLGERRHGDGFWCRRWSDPPPVPETDACVAEAVWDGDSYAIAFGTGKQPPILPERVLEKLPPEGEATE